MNLYNGDRSQNCGYLKHSISWEETEGSLLECWKSSIVQYGCDCNVKIDQTIPLLVSQHKRKECIKNTYFFQLQVRHTRKKKKPYRKCT